MIFGPADQLKVLFCSNLGRASVASRHDDARLTRGKFTRTKQSHRRITARKRMSCVPGGIEGRCPCTHLTAARVAGEPHTARRAGRVRQGEGRRLCVIAEQALATPKQDGIYHKPKPVHQPGCEQWAHHIGAAPCRQVAPSCCAASDGDPQHHTRPAADFKDGRAGLEVELVDQPVPGLGFPEPDKSFSISC